jgi:Tripartite tricarboxylate transporter family receptor
MNLVRRRFLHLAAGAAALPALPRIARAQAYPARPVRIMVGFAAAGGADIVARLIGQWLSERLGQPFVIENRPGAASNISTEAVVRSAPDGYTLLLAASPNAINASLYDKLNFNFIRDIAPVASIMRVANVMVVHPSVPATTVSEFITQARRSAQYNVAAKMPNAAAMTRTTIVSVGMNDFPLLFWSHHACGARGGFDLYQIRAHPAPPTAAEGAPQVRRAARVDTRPGRAASRTLSALAAAHHSREGNVKPPDRWNRSLGKDPFEFALDQNSRNAELLKCATPGAVGVGVRDQERASASARSKARFPATRSTSSPTGMAIASTGEITAPLEARVGKCFTRGENAELVAT